MLYVRSGTVTQFIIRKTEISVDTFGLKTPKRCHFTVDNRYLAALRNQNCVGRMDPEQEDIHDLEETEELVENPGDFTMQMIDGTEAASAKRQYEGRINRMIKWIENAYPEGLLGDEVVLPISVDITKDFLGFRSVKTKRDRSICIPRQYNSYQAVNSYLNSVKWHYKMSKEVIFTRFYARLQDNSNATQGNKRNEGE